MINYYTTLQAANIARDKEWNTGSERVSLAFRGNEMAGEVGEACNVIKKLERERLGIRGSRATMQDLADELADVVITAHLTAMDAGIDLDAAVRQKFNATSEKYGLSVRLVDLEDAEDRKHLGIKKGEDVTPLYERQYVHGGILLGQPSLERGKPCVGQAIKIRLFEEGSQPVRIVSVKKVYIAEVQAIK